MNISILIHAISYTMHNTGYISECYFNIFSIFKKHINIELILGSVKWMEKQKHFKAKVFFFGGEGGEQHEDI